MCQYCRRYGTTLVSYPWPSDPIKIEPLPPMSEEMAAMFDLYYSQEYEDFLRAERYGEIAGFGPSITMSQAVSYSGMNVCLKQFTAIIGTKL